MRFWFYSKVSRRLPDIGGVLVRISCFCSGVSQSHQDSPLWEPHSEWSVLVSIMRKRRASLWDNETEWRGLELDFGKGRTQTLGEGWGHGWGEWVESHSNERENTVHRRTEVLKVGGIETLFWFCFFYLNVEPSKSRLWDNRQKLFHTLWNWEC